jgi:NAD(P)-dependent dehydrogenase (short-subunit alcohol dehydrogenase family)
MDSDVTATSERTYAPPFAGRVAVVTGGSAGIGLGIARALGRAGARIAIWARDIDRCDEACRQLADQGIDASGVSCDVGDEESVDAAMANTLTVYGRVDVVVANAGYSTRAPFVDTAMSDWSGVLATNLTGTFLTFRAGARDMVARGDGGALLAVSSLAAHRGYSDMVGYCATKAGLGGLVRALAVELAPHRIRCNALLPGFTVNSVFSPDSVSERRGRSIAASIPAGRWGNPDDIGRAALYLADPTLPYHTGASVEVDGALVHMPPETAAATALRQHDRPVGD